MLNLIVIIKKIKFAIMIWYINIILMRLIFIVVFALALPLFADTIYDPYGKYKGLLDDKSRFF